MNSAIDPSFSKIKKYFSILISIGAICLLCLYIFNNTRELTRLLDFSIYTLFVLILFVILNISFRGITNFYLYRLISVRLSLPEGIGLAVLNNIGNQLPLAGGMVAKAVYLNHKYKLSFSHYLSVTTALYVCVIGISGITGLATLLYLYVVQNTPFYWSLWFAYCGFITPMAGLWFPIRTGIFSERLKNQISEFSYGWQALGRNPKLHLKLCFLQILILVIIGYRYFYEFQIVSQDVGLSHCLLFSASTTLTRLLSFAPGAIGFREGIVGLVSKILGFDFAIGAIVVLIDRLLIIITASALSLLYLNLKTGKEPA
jgi:uncharacterized membrane protein YbhN (UPF0104 family)